MALKLIKFFAVLAGLQLLPVIFLILAAKDATSRASAGMVLGLFLFWIIVGGLLMKAGRDRVKKVFASIPGDWRVKFTVFAIILALIEEAVTTAMTNTAVLYGVSAAQAHITASGNYWEVVLTHSVILFAPMLAVWAWLLSRFDFRPEEVFLLWGLSGYIMEVMYGGLSHLSEIGFWVFVYGLMIYLPAYCLPPGRGAKKPGWIIYVLAIPFVIFVGLLIGGPLAAIARQIINPHYFPGVK